MNSAGKWLLCFVLAVIAVLVGLRLDHRFFPVAAVQPPPQEVPQCPKLVTVEIRVVNGSPQAPDVTLSRTRRDEVRWVNRTDREFLIEFLPEAATSGRCPLEGGCIQIPVLPNSETGYYQVADRADEHGKRIRFKYHSTKAPLGGPPGEPGMTVED